MYWNATAARFFAATNTPLPISALNCSIERARSKNMAVPHSVPFPSGGTWFDTLHKTFDHVHVQANNDNGIPTSEFLEAAESLTTLFGEPSPSHPLLPFQFSETPDSRFGQMF